MDPRLYHGLIHEQGELLILCGNEAHTLLIYADREPHFRDHCCEANLLATEAVISGERDRGCYLFSLWWEGRGYVHLSRVSLYQPEASMMTIMLTFNLFAERPLERKTRILCLSGERKSLDLGLRLLFANMKGGAPTTDEGKESLRKATRSS